MNMRHQNQVLDRVDLFLGDITTLAVDAIVNAANRALSGGGGVDGAIHRAAGPELVKASRALGPCATGDAKITPGFNLTAKYVIHAVGPVWYGGNRQEAELLASCYQASFKLAQEYKIKTIAFPAISTGAYGYPLKQATAIAVAEVKHFLSIDETITKVIFACFDQKTFDTYQKAIQV